MCADAAVPAAHGAAVAGRHVPHDLLARVVGEDGPDLDGALRAAVERHVLVSVRAAEYSFRHALLAEAVYDDLLPGERVRWHRGYADALAAGGIDGTAAELARHARADRDIPTAISASLRAGDEAMAVGGRPRRRATTSRRWTCWPTTRWRRPRWTWSTS